MTMHVPFLPYAKRLLFIGLLLGWNCSDKDPVAGGSDTEDYEGYGFSGVALYTDDSPAANAKVEVHPFDSYGFGGSALVRTDAAGAYRVSGLQAGDYMISITDTLNNGVLITASIRSAGDSVALGSSVLLPTGSLQGTVTLPDTATGLYPLWVQLKGVWKSTATDVSGAYRIDDIPAGTYTVRVESPWPANVAYGIMETTGVVVASGAAVSLDIDSLPPRAVAGSFYSQDSLAVRKILDTNSVSGSVEEFTHVLNGRIVSFHDVNGAVSVLPADIGALDRLEVLVLMYGHIIEWPAELGNLANLKQLSLVNQGLAGLPDAAADLTSLVSLDLSGNPLDSLPEEVFSLLDLHSLYADSAGLVAVSPDISSLPLLNTLSIKNNSLTDLPVEITRMQYLEKIRVAGNAICAPAASVEEWLLTIDSDWDSTMQCR